MKSKTGISHRLLPTLGIAGLDQIAQGFLSSSIPTLVW